MITLTILAIFFGFYFLYESSDRAEPLRRTRLAQWITVHRSTSRRIGALVLVISIAMAIRIWGIGAGSLFFTIILMTTGSLVVMLGPIRVLGPKSLVAISILSFLIELSV